mgnify:CR=1 FL=1
MENFKSGAVGLITGFINGLLGSGGGTWAVFCMERFLNFKAHKAHASAIAIILPISVLSLIIYFFKGTVLWKVALLTSVGGVLGGILGAKLLNKISGIWLHRIFGIAMIAAAVRMVF